MVSKINRRVFIRIPVIVLALFMLSTCVKNRPLNDAEYDEIREHYMGEDRTGRDDAPLSKNLSHKVQAMGVTENKHCYGPCNGVVLDAETRKPIAGAQVMTIISGYGGIGIEMGESESYQFTQTDEEGRYHIPRMCTWMVPLHLSGLEVVIYKAGYVAYRTGKKFKSAYQKAGFSYRKNVVLLEKLDYEKFTLQDHYEHVKRIWCDSVGQKSMKERIIYCREAKKEMILACMANPLPRDICEGIINEDLGLTNNGGKKK